MLNMKKTEDHEAGDALGLAACEGCRAVVVVGRTLRFMAGSPGCPAQYMTVPLPPGRALDASPNGPSVLMEDGRTAVLYWLSPSDNAWQRCAEMKL